MKKHILVIVFNLERAREHEWYVELLDRKLYEIEFAVINFHNSFLIGFLNSKNVKVHLLNYSGKKDLLWLTWNLYLIMVKGRFNIVHAHLFEAALTGMIAAFFARIKNRITTRHYSDYHHVYFPSVVKYDMLINRLSTRIIAVSENVRNILLTNEGVDPAKIVLIHHGIDLNEFNPANITQERIATMRSKHDLPADKLIVGVISRFIIWKGLQYVIPAFKLIHKKFPDAILVLANAQGPYKEKVLDLLANINPSCYRLIEFENDVPSLLRTFTCFVHTPVSPTAEAFGQTYIESLASGVPGIFTKSGVAAEFALNGVNCITVPYCDEQAIYKAVSCIILKEVNIEIMSGNGLKYVTEHFDMKIKYSKISELYSKL